MYACKKLEENVSPDDFRTFTITIFPSCPIEKLSNVREMFNAIIKHRRWSYQEHRKLRNILHKMKIADPETKAKFNNYSQLLHSYNVTTRILDWIKRKKLDQRHFSSAQSPSSSDHSKLNVKLRPYKVNDKTLQYVKELWEAITEDLLELPDLDAVLYDIAEGCICVTWLIPATEELEHLIRRQVSCREDFLERHNIVQLILNDECIYKEQVPV